MKTQEFSNFLTSNNWIRVNNTTFHDGTLSVTINGEQVNMYRQGSNFCIFFFNLKDAIVISESKIRVTKDGKNYEVPFRKDAI